jgi:hypothetical protein
VLLVAGIGFEVAPSMTGAVVVSPVIWSEIVVSMTVGDSVVAAAGPTSALCEAEAIGLERATGNGESESLEDDTKSDDLMICAGSGAELC